MVNRMQNPATESDLMGFLEELSIETIMHRHAPVHTVEDAKALRGDIAGGHCKCLFVRDKKKRFALVVLDENKTVDLKALSETLGLGRLSFANPDYLFSMLGVKPGSVTPFALINARVAGSEAPMIVALDEMMMGQATLNYHPLHNSATITIAAGDLRRFVSACGYQAIDIKIPE